MSEGAQPRQGKEERVVIRMSTVTRALRLTAFAGALAAVAATPASAQRVGVPLPGITPPADLPNVPVPAPGQPVPTVADDAMSLPDILDRRGNHQAAPVKALDGAFLNDPAYDPVISPDSRTNRYIAFTSTSTNIVGG